jgi:glycosyltransferase involved in cell wall biosynthesis
MTRKGIDLLAPIMVELGDSFELRYTGGGQSRKKGPAMPANSRDIGRLEGPDDVAGAMRDADALLFPTRSEGFGLVVIEAMACGLPVITTACPPLTEIVEHGVTGLLCRRDEVDDFVASARLLAGDEELARSMGARGRQRAIGTYDIGGMIDEYSTIYAKLSS